MSACTLLECVAIRSVYLDDAQLTSLLTLPRLRSLELEKVQLESLTPFAAAAQLTRLIFYSGNLDPLRNLPSMAALVELTIGFWAESRLPVETDRKQLLQRMPAMTAGGLKLL